MPLPHQHSFTFTEVMIAAVILALAAAATMGIVGGAQASLIGAETRWLKQHATASAVEFYLMAGHQAAIPLDLLPQGYSATCQLLYEDDLHEEAQQPIRKCLLGQYVITVYDDRGDLVSETRVHKMLKEEDFE